MLFLSSKYILAYSQACLKHYNHISVQKNLAVQSGNGHLFLTYYEVKLQYCNHFLFTLKTMVGIEKE
jgi:hypothetical protein